MSDRSRRRTRCAPANAAVIVAVLVVLGAVLAAGIPALADAQPTAKIARIGVLGEHRANDPWLESFRQGLRELGYTEGRNVVIETRYAGGVVGRTPDLVAELLRLEVDVLLVGGTVAARSARAATTTVPIVFTLVGDPVGSGIVSSLAHPGGNSTGLSNVISELAGKQLDLLKAVIPKLARVGILHSPVNSKLALVGVREAARQLALEVELAEVRHPNEVAPALASLKARRVEAVLVLSDTVFGGELARIAALAAEHRMPAMYARKEFAEAGGLLSYGPDFAANYRRAASYVDKILRGVKPGELPVEQPTKFELVINVKTARALGIPVPLALAHRADQLIE